MLYCVQLFVFQAFFQGDYLLRAKMLPSLQAALLALSSAAVVSAQCTLFTIFISSPPLYQLTLHLISNTNKSFTATNSSTGVKCPSSAKFTSISAGKWFDSSNPGWNVGNTLDAVETEGSWNNPPVVGSTFDDAKKVSNFLFSPPAFILKIRFTTSVFKSKSASIDEESEKIRVLIQF